MKEGEGEREIEIEIEFRNLARLFKIVFFLTFYFVLGYHWLTML